MRHQGFHAAAAEELRTRLEPLATCATSQRLKDDLLAFITQQAAAAKPGELLIGSTEVLESIIGKYKRLPRYAQRRRHDANDPEHWRTRRPPLP